MQRLPLEPQYGAAGECQHKQIQKNVSGELHGLDSWRKGRRMAERGRPCVLSGGFVRLYWQFGRARAPLPPGEGLG
ncbi:hypothetical protein GCM10007901_00340 [Dyella acidisoli]|uniref:Uncharacterized protein n=1 Tax=Dyella acidisoli TaxID=1867834 RepID=A0ABQ5XKY3_9GAMM|nr:hypothetical protein GCM10007901_00340 [Dyella acidisoli]